MNDDQDEPQSLFSDSDQLKLLQLLTRRAMSERRKREAGSASDAALSGQIAPLAVESVPERWRLLPDDVHLHGWQRDALPIWLENGRGTIKVATGGGNTMFALAAANALQNDGAPDRRRVVVVLPYPLLVQ